MAKIGIGLPTLGGGRLDVVGAARHAEARGFESAWVADLVVGDGTPALEATVALAAAAAATERIRLGFGVLSLPLRPVAWLAAQVQALQYVSGGRVLLGVGSGGLPGSPFWPAAGVPGRERGRRTDAALAVLPRLVAGEPTELADRPGRPVLALGPATPVPPILVGGNSPAAIGRAAAYGDGWLPSQIGPETLAAGVERLRELAAGHGRPAPSVHVGGLTLLEDAGAVRAARAEREAFVRGLPGGHGITAAEATAMIVGSPAEAAERVAAYAAAGADRVIVSPGVGVTGDAWTRQCDRVAAAGDLLG